MMNNTDRQTSATTSDYIHQISDLLIDFWPLMRRRLTHINALQAESSMPISHIQLLSMLAREESLSITQISERFEIAKPNITPMVDRMIAEGLVTRTRSNQDKRIVTVVICDKGRERLDDIRKSAYRMISNWSTRLTKEEIEDLYHSLNTMIKLLNKKA